MRVRLLASVRSGAQRLFVVALILAQVLLQA